MGQIIFNGFTVLGPIVIAYLVARVHSNGQRLDRQADQLHNLANGEGDKKIELKVLAMQGKGQVPLSPIIAVAARPTGTLSRTTDTPVNGPVDVVQTI